MYIPIASLAADTKVINKEIVYNDTVLPLKELGENIKVTSIDIVSEYSLEKYLKLIFESNPSVVFNTIQYSKKDEKIYLYTDKEMSLEDIKTIDIERFSPLSNSKEILEELKSILSSEKNTDSEYISLYDVSNIIDKDKREYNEIIKQKLMLIESKVNIRFYKGSVVLYNFGFNLDDDTLIIGFSSDWEFGRYKHIYLKKQDDDLYVSESESPYSKDLLGIVGQELSNVFDYMKSNSEKKKQDEYNVAILDSYLKANITTGHIIVHDIPNAFKIYLNDNRYDYDINSSKVLSVLKGNENDLFKKLYVNINSCPPYLRDELHRIRNRQLNGKNIKKRALKIKEKIFPLAKNKTQTT